MTRRKFEALVERTTDGLNAGRVVLLDLEVVQCGFGVEQSSAAAGDDPLGHRGPGGR